MLNLERRKIQAQERSKLVVDLTKTFQTGYDNHRMSSARLRHSTFLGRHSIFSGSRSFHNVSRYSPCVASVLRFSFVLLVLFGPSWLPQSSSVEAQTVQRVKDTVHNLSASGPGKIRASGETEVCVFCHTPHGAGDVRPLWNRSLSPGPYLIYQSSSMRARVGQPTGASKLCLSCHDGTIALGSVLSRRSIIPMQGGQTRLPPGPSNLGTDLTDDHPISFSYLSSLHANSQELLAPEAIRPPVKLDENREVQCTSCHEPHDNTYGDFLVRPNDSGALCVSCHQPRDWPTSVHATSPAQVTANVASRLGAEPLSTAQNACGSCHRAHGAKGTPWNLQLENISATCLSCHDGQVARDDIEKEMRKPSSHGVQTEGPIGVTGGPYVEGSSVSCSDCHDPHAAGSSAGSGRVPRSLAGVPGVDLGGRVVDEISDEHELCFRCHGLAPASLVPVVSRNNVQPNKRLQFQPTNPSFHPVGNPGLNPSVPSLIPPLTTSSLITCGDCHGSDATRALGGTGPAGPHGSIFRPLLVRRYEVLDFSFESPAAYALCYRCHQRDSILRDDSFKGHRLHVVDQRTPCSACHDPHGISSSQGDSTNSSHLINFDRAIVLPNAAGRLEFEDLGRFRGQCYLSCHGVDHNPLAY